MSTISEENTYIVLQIIKLTSFPIIFRLRSGSGNLNYCRYFSMFCDIQNVVHNFEPGKTPIFTTSNQAPNYCNVHKCDNATNA